MIFLFNPGFDKSFCLFEFIDEKTDVGMVRVWDHLGRDGCGRMHWVRGDMPCVIEGSVLGMVPFDCTISFHRVSSLFGHEFKEGRRDVGGVKE